jgi:hypothetical protein
MSYIFNSQVLIWLLLIIVAIFSFFNFYLFIKLLRKFDDHQILTVDALELLNIIKYQKTLKFWQNVVEY